MASLDLRSRLSRQSPISENGAWKKQHSNLSSDLRSSLSRQSPMCENGAWKKQHSNLSSDLRSRLSRQLPVHQKSAWKKQHSNQNSICIKVESDKHFGERRIFYKGDEYDKPEESFNWKMHIEEKNNLKNFTPKMQQLQTFSKKNVRINKDKNKTRMSYKFDENNTPENSTSGIAKFKPQSNLNANHFGERRISYKGDEYDKPEESSNWKMHIEGKNNKLRHFTPKMQELQTFSKKNARITSKDETETRRAYKFDENNKSSSRKMHIEEKPNKLKDFTPKMPEFETSKKNVRITSKDETETRRSYKFDENNKSASWKMHIEEKPYKLKEFTPKMQEFETFSKKNVRITSEHETETHTSCKFDKNNRANQRAISTSEIATFQPPPNVNVKFISTDEQENADNNDSQWQDIKTLSTEEQFKEYANSIFDYQICTPNKCQSYQGFRRKYLRQLFSRQKRFNINELEGRYHNTEGQSLGDRKRKASNDVMDDMPLTKRPKLMPFESYMEKTCKAISEHKLANINFYANYRSSNSGLISCQELLDKNWRLYLRHFEKSKEETKSILMAIGCDGMHINKNESELYISDEELKKITDLEQLFGQFIKFYGPNEEIKCKSCTKVDGRVVWHPY